MVGLGMRSRLVLFLGSPVWAILLELVESTGVWPQGLWKSAVFQGGHINPLVRLISPVVGRASCA